VAFTAATAEAISETPAAFGPAGSIHEEDHRLHR
jgi:hypothetical protein